MNGINVGGRPEIGGKIGPVSYGEALLAEIDRRAAAAGQSRSAWLRDAALKAVNADASDDISWPQMSAAGIDTEMVELTRDCKAGAADGKQWVATSADGQSRVYFGYAQDPDDVVPEGEHAGWDLGVYDLLSEDRIDTHECDPGWHLDSEIRDGVVECKGARLQFDPADASEPFEVEESHRGYYYFEPFDVAGLLAQVARCLSADPTP